MNWTALLCWNFIYKYELVLLVYQSLAYSWENVQFHVSERERFSPKRLENELEL